MQILPSRRELRRRHWNYFGRPFAIAIVTAICIGLGIGILWIVAGLFNLHPLW